MKIKKFFICLLSLSTLIGIIYFSYFLFHKKPEKPENNIFEVRQLEEMILQKTDSLKELEIIKVNFQDLDTTALGIHRGIFTIYINKRDEAGYGFTDYTDKLIKLRLSNNVKKILQEEDIRMEPYFDIRILTR